MDCLLWWRQLPGCITAPQWGPYAWTWGATVWALMINTTWMNLNVGPLKVEPWDDHSPSKYWLQLIGDSEPDTPTKLLSDPNLQKFCNHKCLFFKLLTLGIICYVSLSYWILFNSVTPGSIAHQAPLSMGLSQQEYKSGLPFPPPEISLTQGSNPYLLQLLHRQTDSLPWATWEAPICCAAVDNNAVFNSVD